MYCGQYSSILIQQLSIKRIDWNAATIYFSHHLVFPIRVTKMNIYNSGQITWSFHPIINKSYYSFSSKLVD